MAISASDIRQALKNDEFVFFYQPKVSFLNGRISGAEALIRWCRGGGAVLAPKTFMPVAEATGLAPEITRHMFPKLLEDFQRIRGQHGQEGLAFNISGSDLDAPNLVALIREVFGAGTITLFAMGSFDGVIEIPGLVTAPARVFGLAAGALLVVGYLKGLFNWMEQRRGDAK